MTAESPPGYRLAFSPEQFQIDLNTVRDGNRVVALVGFRRPQRVPFVGESAIALDEDGNAYDAHVEAVMPDSRVYLRLLWSSKRVTLPTFRLQHHSRWGLNVPGGVSVGSPPHRHEPRPG